MDETNTHDKKRGAIQPGEPADANAPETDSRFVSGRWRGFYIQSGTRGKQELILRFAGGVVSGEGRDPAGGFVVKGSYDTERGRAWINKVYPTHVVEYDGHAEPSAERSVNGGIWGTWQIRYIGAPADRGGFHIWPEGEGLGDERELKAERPMPAAKVEFVPVGVGAGLEADESLGADEPWR
jgi:hypothetical protein